MEDKNKKEDEDKEESLDQFFKKEDEVLNLLSKAIEVSEKNQKDIKYVKRFVVWLQVWGAIKFFLILVPIIVGIFYLPSFLEQWVGTYQDLLNNGNAIDNSSENLILQNIIK